MTRNGYARLHRLLNTGAISSKSHGLTNILIPHRALFSMKPSEEDVANFLAFAPDAGEGKAFVFLEVNRHRAKNWHKPY